MPAVVVVLIVLFVIFDLVFMALFLPFVFMAKRAADAGATVQPVQLLLLKLRGGDPKRIVNALIKARQAGGEDATVELLEAHALAGGDVDRVAEALKTAKENGMEMTAQQACEFDLTEQGAPEQA